MEDDQSHEAHEAHETQYEQGFQVNQDTANQSTADQGTSDPAPDSAPTPESLDGGCGADPDPQNAPGACL